MPRSLLPARRSWPKVLLFVFLFSVAIRLTMLAGFYIPVPGSSLVIDTREVFTILGSALTGPIGGLLIGFFSGISPEPRWFPIIVHMILGFWAGWFFSIFVRRRTTVVGELLSSIGLVLIYYGVLYLLIIVLSNILFPFFGGKPPFGDVATGELLVRMAQNLLPEWVLTLVVVSLVILAVPARYRRVVWLEDQHPEIQNGETTENRLGRSKSEEGRLSLRLTAWFFLLSLIPLVVVGVFIQTNVTRSFLLQGAGKQREIARAFSREYVRHGYQAAVSDAMAQQRSASHGLFVLDSSGTYLVHTDSSKVGRNAREDFSEAALRIMLNGTIGLSAEHESGMSIGYSTIEGTTWRVVSVEGKDVIAHSLDNLQQIIFFRLGISFVVIALAWGFVIWYIVGRPMRLLTATAEEIGRGNLQAGVDPRGMGGEVAILARAFNEMTGNLRVAYHAMESEIAERKSVEKTLAEREKQFRLLAENSTDMISRHDIGGRYLYASPACRSLLGVTPEDIVGRSAYEFVHPEDVPLLKANHSSRLATGSAPPVIFRVERMDGAIIWVESEGRLVTDPTTGTTEIHVSSRDVSSRIRAEEAVRESEKMLKTLIHQSTDPIYLIQNNRFVFVNKAWEQMFGYTSEVATGEDFDVMSIVAPESKVYVEERPRRYASGEQVSTRYEMAGRRRNGSRVDLDVSVAIISWQGKPAIQGIYRDITERKKTEDTIRHKQKTESLGILAGGIAHDFNNLLQAMVGQTSLALRRMAPEHPAHESVQKAERAAEKAADLTRQLLAYSGRGTFNIRPLDLNLLIQENLHLLELAIPKEIVLERELGNDLPLIRADAGQMQQVVMNLIINASEAIGRRPGRILLRTSLQTIDDKQIEEWEIAKETLSQGEYIRLEVIDNGSGMSPDVVKKIFDPFFSTKVTGRGLGLSAVVGIVRGHRGALRVESEEGRGTTFSMIFPASGDKKKEESKKTDGTEGMQKTHGCVLVIDDEADVREVVTDMLDDIGVRTIAAGSGEEGIKLYEDHPGEVDLVLLDLSMPGIGGKETFRRLKGKNPGIKIILSSGYSRTEVTEDFNQLGLDGFIQKPYRFKNLSDLIQTQLNRGRTAKS